MAEANHSQETSASTRAGHELGDLSPRNIVLFAVALSAAIVLVLLVSYGLLRRFANVEMRSETPLNPLASTRQVAPGPRLQVNPEKDIREMRAAEDARLNSYGWVDPTAGIVRIPIDRAMEILAQKGLPARAAAEEGKQGAGSQEQKKQASGDTSKEQGAR